MARLVKIKTRSVEVLAELNDSITAGQIWDALPISAPGNTWGDEVYFGIPVECKPENPQAVVEEGDLGYWPPGSAFCIFFGPTPMSRGNEVRPASPVNVFGRIKGDPKVFRSVRSGEIVTIEKAEE